MAVVVEHRQLGSLGGGSDEEVWKRGPPMMKRATLRKQLEDIERTAPDAVPDRNLSQLVELFSPLPELADVARGTQKLELDHVTGCNSTVSERPGEVRQRLR